MKRLKTALILYVLPIIVVLAIAIIYKQAGDSSMRLCKQPYALCTSAQCIPDPSDSLKAICLCDVEEGPSLSTVACNRLKDSTDAHGIRTVYSTFSLHQFKQGLKVMKCPSGTPWTWCLNKRCTVDPSNPKQAICLCDVKRSEEWITLGGNCDTSTCETGYWSGSSIQGFKEANGFISESLEIRESSVRWCRGESQ